MNLEQGVQVTDIFGIARRRGKLIATVAGAVILATYWISMALPNLYMSSAVILVEPQSVDEGLIRSGVRESDLNERLGLMTAEILSRTRLSKIIDEENLYQSESRSLLREVIIDLMRSYVSVEPVFSELEAGTRRNQNLSFNTFRIVYHNERSLTARDVAQHIANDFIDANIKSRTEVTAKSLDFMEEEIRSLGSQTAIVEKAIADVKEANPGQLPEDMNSNQRVLQFAVNDLRDAQRSFDAAASDAAFWKNQAITAGTMESSRDVSSPGHRLRLLQLELGSLSARGFTQKHPDIVRVASEIQLLADQIAARGSSTQEGPPRSVAEQNARSEQGRAQLRARSASLDIERLRSTIEIIEARLAATPAVAERLYALGRQYEHLNRSFQDFSSRRQQAGVQADLERRQLGEKFRILELAFAAPEPSSPNRILLLSLGAILGIDIGVGVGLLAEVADTSLHTTNDLQTALGIPVLVSVPRIMLQSDRVARTRRIVRESLAAVGVVLFCLVGGALTYYIVNIAGGPEEPVVEEEATTETEARLNLGLARG